MHTITPKLRKLIVTEKLELLKLESQTSATDKDKEGLVGKGITACLSLQFKFSGSLLQTFLTPYTNELLTFYV